MIRIFRHLRTKEWCFVILSVLFIVAQVWLDLRLPEYMTEITALVQTEGSEMAEIYSAGGKMLLCALGSLITSVVVGFFAAQVAANLSRRLRREIFEKVESFSIFLRRT